MNEMKRNRKLLVSSFVCLLPMFLGLLLWRFLPQTMARHIGWLGVDGVSPKHVVVLIIPLLFLALHLIVCLRPGWLNQKRHKWVYAYVPVISNAFFVFSVLFSRK